MHHEMRSRGEKLFQVFLILFLLVLSFAFLVPFIIVFSSSLLSEKATAVAGSYVLIPTSVTFNAYKAIFSKGSLMLSAYKITALRIVVGTSLNMLLTSMLAYGLSKKDLPGRSFFNKFVLLTMFFSGGMIPSYIVVKNLGLVDTFWVMIIPVLVSPWNMILMRKFFSQLPESLFESAELEGASPFRQLFAIVIPLSKPVLATVGLFYAVAHWNAWFDAMMYISDRSLWPVQLFLRNIIFSTISQGIDADVMATLAELPPAEAMKCAVIIACTLPVLFLYPFLQKYFVKGVLVGSVKG